MTAPSTPAAVPVRARRGRGAPPSIADGRWWAALTPLLAVAVAAIEVLT